MKNDISIVYYSACRIPEKFASNIRQHLLSFIPDETPIISVTHKPVDFGKNIVVDFPYSVYSIYRQILIGAKEANTEFVMCAEDDALYNLEHFSYRPPSDIFAYNSNCFRIDHEIFFHRTRSNMSMCIASRELMIETLEKRFERFPRTLTPEEMGNIGGFGEPGRFEHKYGLPTVKLEQFQTKIPTLVFNHRNNIGGVRKTRTRDAVQKGLQGWGRAIDLWCAMMDGEGMVYGNKEVVVA